MSTFSVSRSVLVQAPRERVHALLEDLHQWERWSPWQELDPAMDQTYSGAERGVGAQVAWSGNKKAGAGEMQVMRSEPTLVDVEVRFLKPFKATNLSRFELVETGEGTEVTWTMSGTQNLLMKAMFAVMRMEQSIGADFERGLARLKTQAELG